MNVVELISVLLEGGFSYGDITKPGRNYVAKFLQKVDVGEQIQLSDKTTMVIIKKNDVIDKLRSFTDDNQVRDFLKSKDGRFTIDDDSVPAKLISWTKIEKTPFSVGDVKFNRGDVAEGILGAAIAAKFKQPFKTIDIDDIKSILTSMNKSTKTASTSLKSDKTPKSGNDNISLTISLKPAQLKALFDDKNWSMMNDEFTAAVKYANSTYVFEHADLLGNNGTDDTVDISSVGSVDEKGTKVDLKVMIGINKGEPVLTNLNLSLKAGQTKNLEQTGVSYEKISDAIERLGIDIKEWNAPFVKEEDWYASVFKLTTIKLNKMFQQKGGEKTFIHTLSSAIKYFATKDEDVSKVHLNKGDFKVFSYKDIESKLSSYELEAYYALDNKRPKFGIREVNSKKNILLTFRLEVRNGGNIYKMHIEGGDLLDTITIE
jgi:hypothetical protein